MSVEDVLKRIKEEQKELTNEMFSAEGLLRLQETMQNYDGEYRLIWSNELEKEMAERPTTPMHKTGLASLDVLIDGFREQQLISLFAHTKHGKTQMGMFLVEQMELLNPVVIPMEQSAEEIIDQRKSNNYSIPKFLTPRHLAARRTVDWIEERIVEGIAKHNTKFVMIDHLGYIDDAGKDGEFRRENQAYRIEKIMQGLKNAAKKWNVIILLLVHISQSDEGRPPTLADIKGSSSVAQESDFAISIWRKNEVRRKVRVFDKDNKALLSVQANRRTGKNGHIGLTFNTTTGRYEENNTWVESLLKAAENEIENAELFDSV